MLPVKGGTTIFAMVQSILRSVCPQRSARSEEVQQSGVVAGLILTARRLDLDLAAQHDRVNTLVRRGIRDVKS